jgi:hypothetical protein
MRYWFIGLAFCFAGCASVPVSPEEQARLDTIASRIKPPATLSGAFSIDDQRKPDAKKFRNDMTGLAGGFSCFLGIFQLGDSKFAADRIARLENALAEAFPGRSGPLIVRRYDIYLNQGSEVTTGVWSAAIGGALGAAAASGGLVGSGDVNAPKVWRKPKCDRERMHSGWFDPNDLTSNYPPLTVELDVSVFGQDYSVNAAHSSEMVIQPYGVMPSPVLEAILQTTMDKANARLVKAIQANSPPKTD